MIEFKVDADSAGMRLDKFLRKKLERVPVSHLFKMIRTVRGTGYTIRSGNET